MTAPDDPDDEWIHTLSNDSERQLKCRMLVGSHKVTFQVDTGATVNTLPARYADNIKPTTRTLEMWNNKKAAPLGICHTVVKNPKSKKTYSIEFVVVSDNYTPLLGYTTTHRYSGTQLHTATRLHNYTSLLGYTTTHRYSGTQLHTATRVHNYTPLLGYTTTHRYSGTQLHTATRVQNCEEDENDKDQDRESRYGFSR